MPDGLPGAYCAAGAPGDAKNAEQDQHEADLFRVGERLMQDGRCKKRYRQRHYPGKERARMRRRSEQQTCIRQQDRSAAADHDCRQPDPAEPLEREPPAHHVGQQKQTGHAKAKRSDVPWREAGPESQASHHDPSGPDRDGCKAVEGTADIFRCSASTDGEIRHHRLRQQWTPHNLFSIF